MNQDYIIRNLLYVRRDVRGKEKRKYKDIVVDNATLEDIMLFYIKGGAV